jgi:anti-sigma regulatory factor (Ser/Thr protein kinase)/ActR/RegA family two-component response regulator
MRRKALIFEDNSVVATFLVEALRQKQFQSEVVGQCDHLIALVSQRRPDLIVLNAAFGQGSGYEMCENLKLDRETNRIPLIMLVPPELPDERTRGLLVGANSYLFGPLTEAQIGRAVDEVAAWRAQLESHGTEGEIHFHLLSDTRFLEELNQLLASLFLYTGLSESQIKHLSIAVREIGINAIEWGHRNEVERLVTVIYRIDSEKVTILIRDSGPGFDPGNLPHAARLGDPVSHLSVRESLGLREGGFGLLVARGLVDDLQFNETGNEVRLIKCFPPVPGPRSDPSQCNQPKE